MLKSNFTLSFQNALFFKLIVAQDQCLIIKMTKVKFTYSEKASKFCKIFTLLLSVCTVDRSTVEILQNFVAFSEYTNFTYHRDLLKKFLIEKEGTSRNHYFLEQHQLWMVPRIIFSTCVGCGSIFI